MLQQILMALLRPPLPVLDSSGARELSTQVLE